MRVLLESPERWSKVYAISRRPPPPEMMDLLPAEHRARVEHVASGMSYVLYKVCHIGNWCSKTVHNTRLWQCVALGAIDTMADT